MENGGLGDKFGELTVNDAKDSSLFQVMKAVEAAEATIHQQVEENSRLKAELQRRDQELENLKLDRSVVQKYNSGEASDEHGVINRDPQLTSVVHLLSPISLHQEPLSRSNDPMRPYDADGHSGNNKHNGSTNLHSAGQTSDNAGYSHLSSPTDISFSPGRYLNNGEYDSRTNIPAQGLMPVAESNNHSNLLKQIREHEMEISQLRKRLTEYSIKEAQIRNEKYILEKRIAHMRMAFDQQQQDLVDAASKALSYRQDIIEENVRLTYSLQDAQQERTTFVSSLLPLLADYSLQPQVSDAQSVVSNVKVLFKHLQEKLVITEAKLKESQYQLTPWRSGGNSPNFIPQSPDHSSGAAYTSSKTGLELVPRPSYSPGNLASDGQISSDWDSRGQHDHQAGASGAVVQNAELDNTGRYSPLTSRDSAVHDVSTQSGFNHEELYNSKNRQVKFKEPVTSSELYGIAAGGQQNNESEHDGTWGPGASPYPNTYEDPSSSYPYLQPVPEEPSSSFSEAADDDPLPAIEGLQISGEACPGRELQACGYSTNGTTSCNFEWVRHLDDGSVQYIEGAKQPVYLVTADDVETYLAIEVQPLDDRKRKGELVRVFANDHRKINCDPVMHSHIQQTLRNGQTSYKVSLSTGYLDMWEPATLTIKREGYSIKGSGSSDVTISEKFSKATTVTITYGRDYEFSIDSPSGEVHLLKADNDIQDIASLRDLIVFTLRLFIKKAGQSSKGGKKRRVKLFSK